MLSAVLRMRINVDFSHSAKMDREGTDYGTPGLQSEKRIVEVPFSGDCAVAVAVAVGRGCEQRALEQQKLWVTCPTGHRLPLHRMHRRMWHRVPRRADSHTDEQQLEGADYRPGALCYRPSDPSIFCKGPRFCLPGRQRVLYSGTWTDTASLSRRRSQGLGRGPRMTISYETNGKISRQDRMP